MMENSAQPDRIVRPKEAAAILGISPSTLRRLEQRQQLAPRRVISVNTRGFLLSELMEFLRGCHGSPVGNSCAGTGNAH